MIFETIEMQNEFKKDLQDGKIFGLRLVKTPSEVFENNVYGKMFIQTREITGFDEEKFFLKTKRMTPCFYPGSYDGLNYKMPDYGKPNGYVECEAYFNAFDYYDGDILRSTTEISAAVDKKDCIQVTEYQVIRSY